MSGQGFESTEEQRRVIHHDGSAIVQACPGAGKTAVLVERIRKLVVGNPDSNGGRGIAMISFTKAAIYELQVRLTREGILPNPPFPHFIGTFDSFIWRFLVAPLGIPGVEAAPRLIPDKDGFEIRRFPTDKRTLDLSCFDHQGDIIRDKAKRRIGKSTPLTDRDIDKYQNQAREMRARLWKDGWLDYRDARSIAAERLTTDAALSRRFAGAVSARFREVLVDEAQDSNPEDLQIIDWLRNAGIVTKVVCDPHQSIYSFRGGIDPAELAPLRDGFDEFDRLQLTGNFRSCQNICRVVSALRSSERRDTPIHAAGLSQYSSTPVCILAYPDSKVDSSIGERFQKLVQERGLESHKCPVLAKTRASAAHAVGRRDEEFHKTTSRLLRLAKAVMAFHFPSDARDRIEAMEHVHEVMLDLAGLLALKEPSKTRDTKDGQRSTSEERLGVGVGPSAIRRRTYNQDLEEEYIRPETWRPLVISLIRELDPRRVTLKGRPNAWHEQAKKLLNVQAHQLRWNSAIGTVLEVPTAEVLIARTIHSVKGCEFPAVCVVMTNAKTVLDILSGKTNSDTDEVREIYVAASRAKHLLAFAVPRPQAERLRQYLETWNVEVVCIDLSQAENQSSVLPNRASLKPKSKQPSSRTTKAMLDHGPLPNKDTQQRWSF